MNELFDPANFVWILPLCVFGIFIICATCFVLRREIKAYFAKMLFPYKNRYSTPAGIITKNSEHKPQTAEPMLTEEDLTIPPQPLLFNPLAPQDSPAPNEPLEIKSIQHKPKTRAEKIRVFFKEFKDILLPQSKSCFSPKEDLAQKQIEETNASIPPLPKAEEPQQAEEAKAQTEQSESAKDQTEEVKKEEPAQTMPPAPPILPAPEVKPALPVIPSAQQKPLPPVKPNNGPYFMKDRYLIIFALLVLSGFVIFLSARVRLLSAIQLRQYIEIKQLKEELADLKGTDTPAKKVIIYDIPARRNIKK